MKASAIQRFLPRNGAEKEREDRVRLAEAPAFPDFRSILAADSPIRATLSARDLYGTLEETARFEKFLEGTLPLESEREGRRIHLVLFEPLGSLTIQNLSAKEEPNSVQWTMTAQLSAEIEGLASGGQFMAALDRYNLQDALKAIGASGSARVSIGFSEPLAPAKIHEAGKESSLAILMPMEPSVWRETRRALL